MAYHSLQKRGRFPSFGTISEIHSFLPGRNPNVKKIIYLFLAVFTLVIVGRQIRPIDSYDGFDLKRFSALPVQVGGRIKPLDSVARNTLLILASRQKVITPEGRTLKPIEWFMDLTMKPEVADTYRVFKIEFPDDLGLAGLAREGQRYYAFNDLIPHFEEINRIARNIDPEPQKRSPHERQMAELNNGLTLYHHIMHSLHPVRESAQLDRLADEYASYQAIIGPAMEALRKQTAGEDHDADLLRDFIAYGDDYLKLSQIAHLRIIPPPPPVKPMDPWENLGTHLLEMIRGHSLSPYATNYAALTMSFRAGDREMFNQTVASMEQQFRAHFPEDIHRVHFECLFNRIQPFFIAMQLYVLVFLCVCTSWLCRVQGLSQAAFWMLLIAFFTHTSGLIARMYLQERYGVFVTNLYSSAVFVGWGAVLLGIVIEKFFRLGISAAMAALIGFCTLIIAHHLSMSGDTLEMMRAVLDSNFWLATHVTVITFGYSAMFLAGTLALIFIILGLVGTRFDHKQAKALSGMVYGVTCFAALFSLVGTILGGIWADQSWGRFWGWDPKENGALIIVLMTAIFLHARWGSLLKERGLMALALCGNIVTAWSWFGTNLLGVGLHSYGFTDDGFKWLVVFAASQVTLIALANLPWSCWQSPFGKDRLHQTRKSILLAMPKE